MGEEFGAETPFLFFCDFEKDLAAAVTVGRRNEFAHFARFSDPVAREQIPDPAAAKTFEASRIHWNELEQPRHQGWLRFYRNLLKLRCQYIVPHLSGRCAVKGEYEIQGERGLTARWKFPDQSNLILMANLGTDSLSGMPGPDSQIIYASEGMSDSAIKPGTLPPWSVAWFLQS